MAINTVVLMENMPDPGQAFAQAFQQAQQQRVLQQQQMQAQSRQEQYQQFVQRLRTDRSPETMSEFMLAFPEQADAITKAFEPLDQAKKQSQIGFYGQALSALDRGDVETAKQVVQSRLEAARNTIGSEQEAKELEYGLSLLDSNPDALRDGLASAVFTLDPDRYKTLYDKKEKPYVVVPGVGLFLQRDIDAAIAAGDRGGVSEPNVRPKVPQAAIDDLRKNPGTATQFDEVFGPGAAAAALGMSGTPAPADGATSLTPAQYQATVQALGKAKTDDWMRRNNMTVSGR